MAASLLFSVYISKQSIVMGGEFECVCGRGHATVVARVVACGAIAAVLWSWMKMYFWVGRLHGRLLLVRACASCMSGFIVAARIGANARTFRRSDMCVGSARTVCNAWERIARGCIVESERCQ